MIFIKLFKYYSKRRIISINSKNLFYLLFLTVLYFNLSYFQKSNRYNKESINKLEKVITKKEDIESNNTNLDKKCYISLDNSSLRIIHFIITRFLIEFSNGNLKKKIYSEEYILNGFRVMKKYLLTSLENQNCKDFNFILMIGDKANITYIKSLFNMKTSFDVHIIYQKDLKEYLKNRTRDFDVLITTRIDYDDEIYYDAVNDIRKAININKPMTIHGYNRGVYYFESSKKYYEYYRINKEGAMSIFVSLIVILNKINDIYTIYDMGPHFTVRKKLFQNYKSFGIKELNYEPAVLDSGDPKFIYVRQKYGVFFNGTLHIPKFSKELTFNLNKFHGK